MVFLRGRLYGHSKRLPATERAPVGVRPIIGSILGYGLRDEHVISALEANCASHPLFGTGPHFMVSPKGSSRIPQNVRQINYVVQEPDYRGALLTLEAVADLQNGARTNVSPALPSVIAEPSGESVCFIGELLPPGKMTTSQSLIVAGELGTKEIVIGEGYVMVK